MQAAPHIPAQEGFKGAALQLEWPVRDVALVTFTREAELNTVTLGLIAELRRALAGAKTAKAAALILTGTGKAFCAGADLKMLTAPDSPVARSPMDLRDLFLVPLAELLDSFEEMPYPIIAAINGHALGGGCEMALSADFRLMADSAKLGLPEVRIGATPGAGGVQKLIRHVGRSKALEWILLGSPVSAEEAQLRGLVFEIARPGQLLARALDLAGRLALLGPMAIAQAKASVYVSEDADLRTARRFGVEALTVLAGTAEWREGVQAFIEKRAPRFRASHPLTGMPRHAP